MSARTRTALLFTALLAVAALVVAGLGSGIFGGGGTRQASGPAPTGTGPAPPATQAPVTQAPATQESPPEPSTRDRAAEAAAGHVAGMDLRQLAGQVVVATYAGTGSPAELVREQDLGGVIVMADNMTGTDQVREVVTGLHQDLARSGRDWPVFVGVDQEGGLVERAQDQLTRWPTFMSYGAADDEDLTRRAAAASGAELRDLGFTVVFAPVADVTVGPQDPTISSRSPGSDPDLVARHAVAAGHGYLDAGIVPVVKHFPGHGSVTVDSHLDLPVQDRTAQELESGDLPPFRAAVAAELPAVMVGHLAVTAAGSTRPATLEPAVVTGMLREELGFDGLVVTDAMNMAAVADRVGPGQAAVQAVAAGVDVVLMPTDPVASRDALVAAVESGELDRDRVEQAVHRQLTVLLEQELVQQAGPSTPAAEPGSFGTLAAEVSAAALTLVSGPCREPLAGPRVTPLGEAQAVDRFTAAAQRAGLEVGPGGTTVALRGPGAGPASADVVVALDTPYLLGASAAPVRLALFGDTPGAMSALVDVLTGDAVAPGRLPVQVAGVGEPAGC